MPCDPMTKALCLSKGFFWWGVGGNAKATLAHEVCFIHSTHLHIFNVDSVPSPGSTKYDMKPQYSG